MVGTYNTHDGDEKCVILVGVTKGEYGLEDIKLPLEDNIKIDFK
jgi:hypothetical protein